MPPPALQLLLACALALLGAQGLEIQENESSKGQLQPEHPNLPPPNSRWVL